MHYACLFRGGQKGKDSHPAAATRFVNEGKREEKKKKTLSGQVCICVSAFYLLGERVRMAARYAVVWSGI
jgi:hypothetical protein